MTDERCGVWVALGGYRGVCMRPVEHDGECLPLRSEVMRAADILEEQAQGIHNAVVAIDQDGGWPYEGPKEEA